MPDSLTVKAAASASASAPPVAAHGGPTPTPLAWTPSSDAARLIPATRSSRSNSIHPEPSRSHSSKQAEEEIQSWEMEPLEPVTVCCIPWKKWWKSSEPHSEAALIKSLKFSHDDVLVLRANFQELKHIYTTPSDGMFHLDLFVKRFYENFCMIDSKAQQVFNGQPSFWLIKHLSGMVFHMIKLIDNPPELLEKVRGVAPQHRGMDITQTSFIGFRHAFVYTTIQSFLLENPFDLQDTTISTCFTPTHQVNMSSHEWKADGSHQITRVMQMLQEQIDQHPQDPTTTRWRHAIEGAHVWNRLLECTSRVIVFYMGCVSESEMEIVKEAQKYKH